MTKTPEELVAYPTLTPPAPDTDKIDNVPAAELLSLVVLPSAPRFCAVPEATVAGEEITTLLPLIPTETAPAPSNESEPAPITPELTEVVVLPTAKRLRLGAVCAAVVAPDRTSTPAPAPVVENPADKPPAPETESAVRVSTEDDVAPVVLPSATMFSAVPLATVAGEEITTLEPEIPTETAPAPSNDNAPAAIAPLDVEVVVFPTAKRLSAAAVCAGAEITTLDPLMPTDTTPAPSNDREPAPITPELAEVVVFPTANRLRLGAVCAAEEAEMTILPPDMPTETMPAPSKLKERASAVIEEVDVVVLPTANSPRVCTDCSDEAEMTSVPLENPTEAMPAPEIASAVILRLCDEVTAVVLPRALCPIVTAEATVVGPEITKTPELLVSNPTETPPAPENDIVE